MIFWVIVIAVIGGLAWIRLAPSDPAVWNTDPKVSADQDLADGVRRRIPGNEATFHALHRIALETPRTEVLAGSPDESRVTYITRTQWMGFPDYTTVQLAGDHLEIYARARFGSSDVGVNKRRVESWLTKLGANG